MNYWFSASQNAFYPSTLANEYKLAGTLPDDLCTVDESVFVEFSSTPPLNMRRCVGENGLPCWEPIPPLGIEEATEQAGNKKQFLIEQANDYMNTRQWPGKAVMGRLKESEKLQYNHWLDYLDALAAVDTSSAPDIIWPLPPED